MLTTCVIIFAALALILWAGRRLAKPGEVRTPDNACGTCDGSSGKCEQECMMEASVKPVEYYDDEELDAFSGRPSDGYTDEETEQFRDVLYTMRPDEVAGWNRSLALRGIQVPDPLKDELVLLLSDPRPVADGTPDKKHPPRK